MKKKYLASMIILWMIIMGEVCASGIPVPDFYSFKFKIDSTLVGGANPTPSFLIRTANGVDYNYTVECDNANPGTNTSNATNVTGNHWCEYATEGNYTIRITGTFPRIYFYDGSNGAPYAQRLLSVEQWGTTAWSSMANAFQGCSNMVVNANDNPDLSNVSSMRSMFEGAHNLTFTNSINDWNTSSVTDMSFMFIAAYDFNQDIGAWDTSNVTSMRSMFAAALSFNKDISNWDTSSVTNMQSMFLNAGKFNQNLAKWNIEEVTTFRNMFNYITLDTHIWDSILIAWDAQNVKSAVQLGGGDSHYCYAESARAHLISTDDWNITDGGKDCSGLDDFIISIKTDNPGTSNNTEFTIPTSWNVIYNYNVDCDNDGTNEATAQIGDYTCTYASAGTYTVRIKDNVGDGTGFPEIYFNDTGDKEKILDVAQWGTGKWTSMSGAFYGAKNLVVTALDNPDLSHLTSMNSMFEKAENLTFKHSINDWNTSTILGMNFMFAGAKVFNQDISDWDTSSVTSMQFTFSNALAFNQNISSWNIENVEHMNSMFTNVTLDTDIWDAILIAWDTQNVKNGVRLSGGKSHYCQAETARAHLISADDWNITDRGKECMPDYTLKIRLTGASTSGSNTVVPVILTTTEIQSGTNISDIIIRIPRHDYISFDYNTTMTSLAGKNVNNNEWEYINHPAEYRFKYIGNSMFPINSFSRIGLELNVNPEIGTSGKIDFNIDLKPGSGDDNILNDNDTSQIDYSN